MADTTRAFRSEALARALLTLGALLPYWVLLSFAVVHVTDDLFISDIWNGELPIHVWVAAQQHAHGVLPAWSSQICSGLPLAGLEEPLELAYFYWLQPPAALDALLLSWLLIAAHGAYSLARRVGAERSGAVLAGIAFSGSGYIATQLKHLGIIGTIVWLPLGLALLDRALERTPSDTNETRARRAVALVCFGLVFAAQLLSAFPQSAYICALVYAAYAIYRVLANERVATQSRWLGLRTLLPAALVVTIATGVGAPALLTLSSIGQVSDRAGGGTYEWATDSHYWVPNIVGFLLPYFHGDISDYSYVGKSIFWEDYGYVGAATFLLALYAAVRDGRRPATRMFWGIAVVAYLIVLGPATPVFRVVWALLPGMKLFRFPTRFLVVVDLCLCVLAALGLSRFDRDLRAWLTRRDAAHMARLITLALCVGTALDLMLMQPRQNPMVLGDAWLAPPETVKALRAEPGVPRIYTPFHMQFHTAAFYAAHGWSDLRPYFSLREIVQPNSNLYWDLASADCYTGIAPSWHVDVWGDRRREGKVLGALMHAIGPEHRVELAPSFLTLMRAYGVTHVLSPFTLTGLTPGLVVGSAERAVNIYRVAGASRVHIAERVQHASDTAHAIELLLADGFDPDATVVLEGEVPALAGPAADGGGENHATLLQDTQNEVSVEASAPRGGYLVLADTFFAGWTAEIDGHPAPIYRANVSVRAVQLPAGTHHVQFRFRAPALERGRTLALACFGSLLALLVAAFVWRVRATAKLAQAAPQ